MDCIPVAIPFRSAIELFSALAASPIAIAQKPDAFADLPTWKPVTLA